MFPSTNWKKFDVSYSISYEKLKKNTPAMLNAITMKIFLLLMDTFSKKLILLFG